MGLLIWPRAIECPHCDGTGEVEIYDDPQDIVPAYCEDCPECAGTGEIRVVRAPENE